MDKLNPTFQATPVTPQTPASVSGWYTSEITSGNFTPAEVAWMHAQGWTTISSVSTNGPDGWRTRYAMSRRIMKAENILSTLVADYTNAYNTGRTLNDQRYDDLLTLYLAVLDKSEDSFNLLETDDTKFETEVEAIVAALVTDNTAYAADVDGDLDNWGTDMLAEIAARFAAEQAKALQALIDRGMSTSSMQITGAAAVTREHQRALNDANDRIEQRQLELKHKVNAELISMRSRVLAAKEGLRVYLSNAKDRQVAIRNAIADSLGRLVESRTDSYPDLSELGKLAAGLGAGSAGTYSV